MRPGLVPGERAGTEEPGACHVAAFAASTLTLFALALAASYVPARRATRIDPSLALRAE